MANPCDTGICNPDNCTDVQCREDLLPEIELSDADLEKHYSQF